MKRAGLALYYGFAAWLTVAMVGFALDWKNLHNLPDHYMYVGMQWFEGNITSVRTSGWGKFKNTAFRVKDAATEVVLPAGISTGAWTRDRMPTVDSNLISVGNWIKVGTAGGRPIVVAVFARAPNGQMMAVLPHEVGAARYRWAIRNAEILGNEILFEAGFVIPLFVGAHAAYSFFRRKKRGKPADKSAVRMSA